VVNPRETGVIGDGLVIAATRILGRAAAFSPLILPREEAAGLPSTLA
jgi:hypothetical protein